MWAVGGMFTFQIPVNTWCAYTGVWRCLDYRELQLIPSNSTMAEEIELSIAETNKLRAQLGLPLIPDPTNEPKKEKSAAFSTDSANRLRASLGLRPNLQQTDNLVERTPKSEKSESVKKELKKSQIPLFYNEVELTESWLENIGKKKPKAENTELEDMFGEEVDNGNETEVRLAHGAESLADLKEGDVLTLEDGNVMEEDEDVLANEHLKRDEKVKSDEAERKKQAQLEFGLRPDFGVENEEEQVTEVKIIGNKIINKDLKSQDSDSLGEQEKLRRVSFDFDEFDAPKPQITMKKIKKKLKKSNKRSRTDDETIEFSEPMTTTSLNVEEEENDDLELLLAASRAAKQKRRKLMSAEEIATEIKMHLRVDAVSNMTDGFVYDDTKEFLDTIKKPELKVEKTELKEDSKSDEPETHVESHEEEDKPDFASSHQEEPAADEDPEPSAAPKFSTLLDTLRYLRQNQPESETPDNMNRQAYRDAELNKIKISIEERVVREELEKDHSYTSLSTEEKEKVLDRVLNEKLVAKGIVPEIQKGKYSRYSAPEDKLASYNPQVNLKYTDSSGQELNTKQAWKELLHKYHGLAPKHKKKKIIVSESKDRVVG